MPIKSCLQARFSSKVTHDNFTIKKCGNGHLLSCPDIGALSFLNSEEVLLFAFLRESATPVESMTGFLLDSGYAKNLVERKVSAFLAKIENEGWHRTELIPAESLPMQAVYVTVTLKCNLSCPYCYQEYSKRYHGVMEKSTFLSIAEQVTAINPDCEFIITGGEPFANKDIFWYLNVLTEHGASFSMLTNGSMITDEVARKLSMYTNLKKVQVSIDGITDETNAITRGKGTLARILRGIEAMTEQGITLVLAPTVHRQNLKELEGIARFAVSIGAELSPNNLRECGDKRLEDLALDPMSAYNALKEVNTSIANDRISAIDKQKVLPDKPEESKSEKGTPEVKQAKRGFSLVCGMARSVVNFDWNGDVYPCHLLAVEELKMGNVAVDTIQNIIDSKSTKAMRVASTDIEKCKNCSFVVSCAGGCRAGAYHSYGRLDREDHICNVLQKSKKDALKTL